MSDPNRCAILILDGRTRYESISTWNREVARIIRTLTDLDVIMLDLDDPESFNTALPKAVHDYPQRIAAALSFSGFGIELGDGTADGNLWQRLGIPMLTWLLDHPAYVLSRHQTPSPSVMRIYPNHDFVTFQRDYVRAPHRTAFCGFGAMSFGRQPHRRDPKPGEAPLILFPKTGKNPAQFEESWKTLPHIMQRVIRNAIDHYWGQTTRSGPVVASVLAAADAAGIELRNDLPLLCFFIAQVDYYMRHRKTEILVRQLLPLPVSIFGSDLDYIDTEGARAKILPPVGFDRLIDMISEAFAVISINQNIDDECHDRPYMALGSGALPISDVNPWWEKNYPDLMPYSFDFRTRSVVGAIEKTLADPHAAAAVAWKESTRQCQTRTFEQMVIDTLALAAMQSYFTFRFKSPIQAYQKSGN